MNFDDEQIADEKSIANMKLKYAGLNGYSKVKVLSDKKNELEAKPLGRHLKKADKYFSFLSEIVSNEVKQYVDSLREINQKELEELKQNYNEIEKIDYENPEFVFRPKNVYDLNKQMAQNELDGLKELFRLYIAEQNEDNKNMIKDMIFRRLEALSIMFLRPNFR